MPVDNHILSILRAGRRSFGSLDGSGSRFVEAAVGGDDKSVALLDEQFRFLKRELDGYDLLNPIRRGGQGLVFRARQHRPNRVVALKVLLDGPMANQRQRYRFEREIELIARLNHPNIVTLFDTGIVHGRHYFTMEYVEGAPIDDYVILHDLRPKQIVRLVVKICHAVHHAHQNGIIHRDLNPANILIDDAGEPHVFDFGLATDILDFCERQIHSCTGQILGTLPYLSPEQAGGLDGKTDVRSDIYTLGVILYYLLTDSFPYDVSGSPHEVRSSIVSRDPILLSSAIASSDTDRAQGIREVNRDLSLIVAKALAKPKEDRYQSVEALSDDLERYCSGDHIKAARPNLRSLFRAATRRHKTATAVLGTSLVALVVGTVAVTAAWLETRAQRDNARQAAATAYDAFEIALNDIEQAVRPLPGGVEVRDRLLQRLEERLPTLARLASDIELAPVVTGLNEKQGDIAAAQGRRMDAYHSYEQFRNHALLLEASDLENGDYSDRVTRAHQKLAGVSDDPEPLFKQAIAHGQRVLERTPYRTEAIFTLTKARLAYGECLKETGDYDRAIVQIDCALALVPRGITELRWQQLAATALSAKGRMLVEIGNPEEGIVAVESGLRLREQIVALRLVDVEALRALVLSRAHVGQLKRSAGDVARALDLLNEAATEADRLATMDPSVVGWDRERFALRHDLSLLMLASGQYQDALGHCRAAVALAESIFQADPSDSAQLAYALVLEGRICLADGRWSDARRIFQRALSLGEAAQRAEPDNLRRKQLLAESNYWLGKTLSKSESSAMALPYYRRSHAMFGDIAVRRPDIAHHVLDFIDASVNLAAACLACRTGDADAEARDLLLVAKSDLRRLLEEGRLVGINDEYERRAQAIEANRRILEAHEPSE